MNYRNMRTENILIMGVFLMYVTMMIFDDHKDVDPEYLVPSNPKRAGHLGTRKGAGLVGL